MTGCGGLRSAQLTVLEFLLLVSSDVSIMYKGTSVHITIFFSAGGCASVKYNMCVHRGGCRKLHQLIQDEGPDCGGGVGHAAALHDLRVLSGMHLHVKADSRRGNGTRTRGRSIVAMQKGRSIKVSLDWICRKTQEERSAHAVTKLSR